MGGQGGRWKASRPVGLRVLVRQARMLRCIQGHGVGLREGLEWWGTLDSDLLLCPLGLYTRGWKAVVHGPNPVSGLFLYGSEGMDNFTCG